MKRLIFLLCLLSNMVFASWQDAVPGAQILGEGDFRYWGLRIYTARLWSPSKALLPDTPFALELTYHRAISRKDFVESSMLEIRRLSRTTLPSTQLQAWQAELEQSFVDVQPGDRITGVFLPGAGCRFYAEDRLQNEVRDIEFSQAFFGIWLDTRTRKPALRKRLLGEP